MQLGTTVLALCGILLLTLHFKRCHSSSIRRYRTNLGFYGGYSTDHRNILYSNSEAGDWKNLTQLAEDGGLAEKALICGLGSGAWLAYPETNFQSDGSNYALLLVGDACVPADNINSVQAIGPINKESIGLVTFTEPYFTSESVWITNETTSASGVKSLICPADLSGEWTVEGDGEKVCMVRPKDLIATGVCIFPDLPTQLNMQSATVTIGCPDILGRKLFRTTDAGDEETDNNIDTPPSPTDMDGTKVIVLQTCFGSYGAYKIVDNYLPLPQVAAICKDNADEAHKIGFFKIIDAWKFRMNSERQEEMNPADIDRKRLDENTPHRMKLLTYFFALFKVSCPHVDEIYFNLVRYLFMQHLKAAWEEVPTLLTKVHSDTALSWKAAAEYIQECYDTRLEDPVPEIPEELQCINKNRYDNHDVEDWKQSALDLFLSGDNLDHVIEQVWLMLNYVSPYCAAVDQFSGNQWAEFTTLFRRNFLLPLLQQWIHPGTWQVYYDYMFSGYSLQKGKRQIISCVQDILARTAGRDPVDRPSATVNEFTNLSKKKPPVEIVKRDVKKEDNLIVSGRASPSTATKVAEYTSAISNATSAAPTQANPRKKRSPKDHQSAVAMIKIHKAIVDGRVEHEFKHKSQHNLFHG